MYIELLPDQIEAFSVMHQIEKRWAEIFAEHGYEYDNSEYFTGEAYRQGSWRKILQELSDYSTELRVLTIK